MKRVAPMPKQFEVLAQYNSEVSRGLMHTPAWKLSMLQLQAEFDAWIKIKASLE